MNLPIQYKKVDWRKRKQAREEYIRLQEGDCWFCNRSLSKDSPYEKQGVPVNKKRFPPGFFDYPIHLHHNRKTGWTIGAVHAFCNAVSFDYIESPYPNTPSLPIID